MPVNVGVRSQLKPPTLELLHGFLNRARYACINRDSRRPKRGKSPGSDMAGQDGSGAPSDHGLRRLNPRALCCRKVLGIIMENCFAALRVYESKIPCPAESRVHRAVK